MKKFAKMSLVAAIAVAGTTACAQPLAEAIKNVDVSGTVAYRYNDYEDVTANGNSDATNNYKIALNLKSKVNDDVTANTRFIIGAVGGNPATLRTHGSAANPGNGDTNPSVTLSEVNFTYTGIANTAITVGKQGLATPFTLHRDAMGNEHTGTGILATTNVGPVTLAGAYFNQTNLGTLDANGNPFDLSATVDVDGVVGKDINGDENVIVAGAILNIAGITADAWYIDLQDILDGYTVGLAASYDVADINLAPYARYTSIDLDESKLDNGLWKVGMRAQMGIFGAHLGYGKTDKEGGISDLDGSATTGYDEHWRVTLSGQADSDVIYASANAQVTEQVNLSLNYSDLDNDALNTQETEVYGQVKYDMSKNFYTFVRFGQYEVEQTGNDIDSTIGRVHVQYSF